MSEDEVKSEESRVESEEEISTLRSGLFALDWKRRGRDSNPR